MNYLLKSLMPMIESNLPKVEEMLSNHLQTFPLGADEKQVVYIIYQNSKDSVAYVMICGIDDQDRLVNIRFRKPLTALLSELISKAG